MTATTTTQSRSQPFCLLLIGIFFFLTACQENPAGSTYSHNDQQGKIYRDTISDVPVLFAYDLAVPDHITKLPPVLEEISGICLIDSLRMAGVQDENGTVYFFRIDNGKVEKTIDFSKDGDYEDLTVVGNRIYVIESNGTIYQIDDYTSYPPEVMVFRTPLKSKNDCEGLTFDPLQNALLIACKGSPSIHRNDPYKGFRAVYRFSLDTVSMDVVPFMLIDIQGAQRADMRDRYEKFSYKVAGALSSGGSVLFQPSGIAIHPVTGQFYILASVGKVLIVTDREGRILQSLPIDPGLFTQPEGICFSNDGTLYIASEGNGADAILSVFKPIH